MSATRDMTGGGRERLRQRLATIERLEDPVTIQVLERLGVAASWHCLEVAAGGGSVARWLCERVGSGGRVVATDVETTFLEALSSFPQLEVREHDITSGVFETEAFDLVHARNLLVHIPERETALRKMAAAVKPGGWILIEELDVVTDRADPEGPAALRDLYDRVTGVIYRFAGEKGVEPGFGARVFGLLRSLGFEAVEAEGRTRMFCGDPGVETPHQLAFAELKEPLVAAGRVSEREFDDFMALYDDPAFAWRDALRTATWGRRPG